MRLRLNEPAVALTDLAIGVEAGAFAIALARAGRGTAVRSAREPAIRRWFVAFFAATSVAAIAGAALHGLLPDGDGPVMRRLWRTSLGSIGVAGLSAWCLAALLALPRGAALRVRRLAVAAHAAYLVGLARTNPPYAVAIATYLPGALALGAALVSRLRDPVTRRTAALALAGLGLTRSRSDGSPSTRGCSTTTRPTTRSRRSRWPPSMRRHAGSSGQADASRPVIESIAMEDGACPT